MYTVCVISIFKIKRVIKKSSITLVVLNMSLKMCSLYKPYLNDLRMIQRTKVRRGCRCKS